MRIYLLHGILELLLKNSARHLKSDQFAQTRIQNPGNYCVRVRPPWLCSKFAISLTTEQSLRLYLAFQYQMLC